MDLNKNLLALESYELLVNYKEVNKFIEKDFKDKQNTESQQGREAIEV